ncbi:MAG TPA: hypothetical protein DEB39_09345 [Planctomycetaceae bacterium]|nr:hypothetical protein [Planctomycetaceae bacterium]
MRKKNATTIGSMLYRRPFPFPETDDSGTWFRKGNRRVNRRIDRAVSIADSTGFGIKAVLPVLLLFVVFSGDPLWGQMTSMIDATLPATTRRNILLNNTAIFKRLEEFTFHNPGTPERRSYNVWNEVNGDVADMSDRDGIHGYSATTLGSSFGGEMQVLTDFVLGANMGLFQPDLTLNDGFSRAKGSLMMLSVHSAWFADYWSVKSMIGYGYGDYNAERLDTADTGHWAINYIGLGNRRQDSLFAALEIAKRVRFGDFWIIPSYTFNYVHTRDKSYRERGLGNDNRTFAKRNNDGFLHTFALELEYDFYFRGECLITPALRCAWVHDSSEGAIRSQGTGWEYDPASGEWAYEEFSVIGALTVPDLMQLGAGITVNVGPKYLLFCRYDAEWAGDFSAHHFSAGYGLFW